MATVERYTLRKFLVFKAIIARAEFPLRVADRYLSTRPNLDPDQLKTWDQWNEVFPRLNLIEDADVSEAYL